MECLGFHYLQVTLYQEWNSVWTHELHAQTLGCLKWFVSGKHCLSPHPWLRRPVSPAPPFLQDVAGSPSPTCGQGAPLGLDEACSLSSLKAFLLEEEGCLFSLSSTPTGKFASVRHSFLGSIYPGAQIAVVKEPPSTDWFPSPHLCSNPHVTPQDEKDKDLVWIAWWKSERLMGVWSVQWAGCPSLPGG